MKFLAISLPRHLSPWTKKGSSHCWLGQVSRAKRHQSSAPSALLHHVGSNTSQVASSGVWGLVRLRQTFVRCCLGHYKLVRATEGHELPGQWKSEADGWATAIASGSEEIVE